MNTLLRWLLLTSAVAALLPRGARAEGSKQLTPNTAATNGAALSDPTNTRSGWLSHDVNTNGTGVTNTSLSFLKPFGFDYSGVTFSEDHRMFVRVKAGETLFYGVHRITNPVTSGAQRDLILTLRYGTGAGTQVQQTTLLRDQASTNQSTLIDTQNGVIDDAAQAQAGPLPAAGGYQPLSYTNTTGADQDFYLEFVQVGEGTPGNYDTTFGDFQRYSTYDFWDLTVRTAGGVEQPGRLRSKLWSFSAGAGNGRFASTFALFPLIPDASTANRYYVKRFELAGINPQNLFRFTTNSRGTTASATDFTVSRRSQTVASGFLDFPEFENFIQNPDATIWPSAAAPTFAVRSVAPFCGPGGNGQLAFTTTSTVAGQLVIVVDLNGTAGYQPGTTDVVVEKAVPVGVSTVVWDGLNGLGAPVPNGTTVTLNFKSGAAPVNFPVVDAENNVGGFRIENVRPTTGFDQLFWDDTNLDATAFPVRSSTGGVLSSAGAHEWSGDAGDLLIVNTYAFGNVNAVDRTFTLNAVCDGDGDGVSNATDIDWDNDGISNTEESSGVNPATLTASGVPTYLDAAYVHPTLGAFRDVNGDGINDVFDLDLDGLPNFQDIDADNDGITDVVEANASGAAVASYDAATGRITGAVGTNGMPDAAETTAGSNTTRFPLTNTDGNGRPDFLDIDADNDGIPDNIEGQPTATYRAPSGADADGDGLDNTYDPTPGGAVAAGTAQPLTNTDGADQPDYRDTDSDNDGRLDSVEGWDTDNDGVANTLPSGLDTDQDGLDNAYDTINTTTATFAGNAQNGRLPTFYPDLNNPGGDRDWRQVATAALTGFVFEDPNYGGGLGRNLATTGTVVRPGAIVELYETATGAFVASAVTNASGQYSLPAVAGTAYIVRVVNASVTSSRPGATSTGNATTGFVSGQVGVQTFNGSTDRVGGEYPARVDAGPNTTNANLSTLTAGGTAAQSLARITSATTGATAGPDFGFNFDVVTNTNATGQGSLAQFIGNSNALGGEASLAQAGSRVNAAGTTVALPAQKESSIFMIPSGNAVGGLRAFNAGTSPGTASQLQGAAANVGGTVALLAPTATLTIGGANAANTVIDGSTQTANLGNTNAGTAANATATTVGVDGLTLSGVQKPEVEISGSTGGNILEIDATSVTLRGFAAHGGSNTIGVGNTASADGYLLENLLVGPTADGVRPTANVSAGTGTYVYPLGGVGRVQNNLIGFANGSGLGMHNGIATVGATQILSNFFVKNGFIFDGGDGISFGDGGQPSGPANIVGNLFANNNSSGIQFEIGSTAVTTVTNNTVQNSGTIGGDPGSVTSNLEGGGIVYLSRSGAERGTQADVISRNVVTGSQASGIVVGYGQQNVTISQNNTNGNGSIGIDLIPANKSVATGDGVYGDGDGVTLNDGNATGAAPADQPNKGIDFPILTSATVVGNNLVVRGIARPGVTVEIFLRDTDASNFGEGQTYLGGGVENGAGDANTATTTVNYSGPINGLAQGADNSNTARGFTFTVPIGSLSAAQRAALNTNGITGTASLAGAGTSEFSGRVLALLNAAPVASDVTNAPAMLASNPQTAIQPLVGTDADGTVINFIIQSLPTAAQGQLFYFDGTTTVAVAVGTLIPLANAGGLRFDPAATFVGNASFTYAAIDNEGVTGNTATYTIPVVAPPSCQGSYLDNTTVSNGLTAEYYAGYFVADVPFFQRTAPIRRLDPNIDFVTSFGTATWGDLSSVATGSATNWDTFSARYRGNIFIAAAGSYTFYLSSDDASYLWLDGAALAPTLANVFINNGGEHGVTTVAGTVTLTAGRHDLTALFGEQGGGNSFRLEYESAANGIARQVVPQSVLCAGPAAANNPPVAIDATNATLLNAAGATVLNPNLSATDADGNATVVTFNITTLPAPASGVLFFNGVAVVTGQAIPAGSLGLLAFSPSVGFNGNTTFTYSATDNGGRTDLSPATYTIPVTGPPLCTNPSYLDNTTASNGLTAEYYAGYFADDVPFFQRTAPLRRLDPNIDFISGSGTATWGDLSSVATGSAADWDTYSARYRGSLFIATAGSYTFYLNSDDASYLWLDGAALAPTVATALVNNAGQHGVQQATGTVTLTVGRHDLTALFGEAGGGNYFRLEYESAANGIARQVVPQSLLCAGPAATNNPPVAIDATNTPLLNSAAATVLNPNLSATDPEGNATVVTYNITTLPAPASGVLFYNGVAVVAGQAIPAGSLGLLSFDPAAGATGSTSFTYSATDNGGRTDLSPATYTIPFTPSTTVAGTVFEDVNYGGGAGRNLATAGTSGRPNATVELYNSVGAFVGTTTTNASGQYTFVGVTAGTYTVRVVNASVSSVRNTNNVAGLVPVQTFVRQGGTADDANRVGGEVPSQQDAAANTGVQTLAQLTAGTATAQSITSVSVGAGLAAVSTVDFGFNFDVITNTNNAGQGSLRQFILNSNGLPNAGLDQVASSTGGADPAAGTETSIFMIPRGAATAGIRAGVASGLSAAGVAVITPATGLPAIADANTSLDGTTQTQNVGNTNNVTLGTGGVVGVAATALSQVNGPEVQLQGSSAVETGLQVVNSASNTSVSGLAILGFGTAGDASGMILVNAPNFSLTRSVVGTTATSFTAPATIGLSDGIRISNGGNNAVISNNLFGFNGGKGITTNGTAAGTLITNNEFRSNAQGSSSWDGVDIQGNTATVTNNLFVDNAGVGVDSFASSGGNVTTGNTITGNGRGTATIAPGETPGMRVYGANNVISGNIISSNYGPGILLEGVGSFGLVSNTLISQNSIFNNGNVLGLNGAAVSGQIGIDLNGTNQSESAGTAPFVSLNDDGDGDAGANGLINFPIIQGASIRNGNLVLTGFAKAGATIEFFVAAPDATGFGEGSLFLGTRVEGTADADATTGSYSGLINGLNQGTETGQSRYSFSIPLSSLSAAQLAAVQAAGAVLTSTATLSGQGTSEFSGNAPVRLAPVAVSDVASTTPVTAVTIPATANDQNNIDPLTVDLDPATPGIQPTFVVTGQGTYTTVGAPAGSVIFTPAAGFTGTVSIPYTVNNTSGVTSNVANLTVTVRPPLVDVATAITAPANNATVTAGQPVAFTVVASNPGTTIAPNVVQTLQLPAGLTGLSFSNGGSYNPATGLVTFPTIASLASGANVTFGVTFAAPAAGPFVGTANVSSSGTETTTANNTASVSVNVNPAFDLTTTISGPTATVVGQLTTFAVTTKNNGPSPASGVVQTVQLPTGLSGVYVSNNGTYDPATGIVTFPAVALASGQNVNNTVSFLAPATGFVAAATVNNPGSADTNTGNNTATAPATTVSPAPATVANAFVTIANNAPNPAPGATVTYTVTAGNSGPAAATGLVTTVSLPAGLSVTGLPVGASYNATTGVLTLNAAATVASGASTTYTFQVAAPASGTVTATAFVSTTSADPMPGNNVASVPFTVAPAADVATTINGPTSATAGQPATYTVTTTNNGGNTATGVTQTVQLPVGLTGVTVSGGGTYNAATGVVTFPVIASQTAGTAVTNTISFVPPANGSFVVSAAVGSTSPDGVAANNAASVPTTVTPVADVTVALSGPATAAVGSAVTYAVVVRNNGISSSLGVSPTLQLPAGLSGVTVPNGTYNSATGLVTFGTIATLATGQSVSNTVTLAMPDVSVLSPVAQVSAASADSNLDNNQATLTTTSQAPSAQASDLSVVVTTSGATATPGQPVTFTATYSNGVGSAAAPNVVPQLLLPAGLAIAGLTISNGGSYDPATGIVSWPAVGSLAGGGSFAYTVQLAAPADGPLLATGTVRSDNTDPTPANNVNAASVTITPRADVTTLVSGPASTLPGATVTYAVTSQNNGPSTAANVVQTLTLPAGATNVVLPAGATQSGNLVTFATVAALPTGAANALTNVVSFTAPATAFAVTGNIATATGQGANTATDISTVNTAITNRAPVALAVVNSLQAPEGNTAGPLAISPLSATDADGNATVDTYAVRILPPASQGVLLFFNGTSYVPVVVNQPLTPTQAATLRFDPAAGFVGNVFFTYTATDTGGLVSNTALYTIPVGQDVNSLYTNTPTKGGNANQYQNGDVISNVFDVNGGAFNSAAVVTDNGVRAATTNAAGTSLLAGLGLSLNPLTGQITVTDRTKLVAGTYTLSITTVDAFGGTNTQPVTFTIGANPLPVELLSFGATPVSNRDTKLTWRTASERNSARFDIERSPNGRDFVKIGEVAGQGTKTSPTDYSLVDANAVRQGLLLYYRLRQVDNDGTSAYSPVQSVAFGKAGQPSIGLYPNPATASTTLDLSVLPTGRYTVSLTDMTGRLVRTLTLEAGLDHAVAVQDLAAGSYLVTVQGTADNAALRFTKRLTKE